MRNLIRNSDVRLDQLELASEVDANEVKNLMRSLGNLMRNLGNLMRNLMKNSDVMLFQVFLYPVSSGGDDYAAR